MKDGNIVEQNTIDEIFLNPQHTYTKDLINSQAKVKTPSTNISLVSLKINKLKIWYPIKKGILRRIVSYVKAVDEVSFELNKNTTLGLVGESGSGKTTLVLALLRLIKSEGSIEFENNKISSLGRKALRLLRKEMQIVFQDPFSSLSPRMNVEQIIKEGLDIHEPNFSAKEKERLIISTCEEVGLNYLFIKNYY